MITIETQGYVILGIIVAIVGISAYAVWLSKKCRKDRELLRGFLKSLSESHEETWKLHTLYGSSKSEIAEVMYTHIKKDMEKKFRKLLAEMRNFPSRAFMFFSKEPATNRFISIMFDVIKASFGRWKHEGISLDELSMDFMDDVRAALNQELEKDEKKYRH
ncbi:MAG: hypothetical protein WCJ45_06870 [bacterium]